MARGRHHDSSSSLSLASSLPSLSSLSLDEQRWSDSDSEAQLDGSSSDADADADVDEQWEREDDKQETRRSHTSPRARRRRSLDAVATSPRQKSPRATQRALATATASPAPRHFHALFVRVDPPLLRSLRHLELSGQRLTRSHLRTLAAHAYLLEALASVGLADNQLEDSCVPELRALLSLEGLARADLSRNLLGRGAAKMLADRLARRLALRALDVSGNPRFFAFDDALDVARALAHGVATNLAIEDFRISLAPPPALAERERLILPPPPPQRQQKPLKSGRRAGRGVSDRDDREATPAEAFTRELGERQPGAGNGSALLSLGLVHAELSRRTVVNLMKLANRLAVLDLSFAFAGIAAAQVVATALKMEGYATLTQLSLRGNRLKAMGARAICRALHTNARLTDLDLRRNELRGELLPDLAAMLRANHTLVRLDLSQNDALLVDVAEKSAPWQALVAALQTHDALRSLGSLERLAVATAAQRQTLQRVLERHQQRSDERVLVGVHESMAFEAAGDKSGPTAPPLGPVATITLSRQDPHQREKTLWRQRREIAKQARVSVKWKMRAFAPATDKKDRAAVASTEPLQRIRWRVVVHRKCDIGGVVEYNAANGTLAVAPSPSAGGFELCSVLVYCDEGDAVSIVVAVGNGSNGSDDDDASSRRLGSAVKVLAKEFVVLPHPLTLRHCSVDYDANEPLHAVPHVTWLTKCVRDPAADAFPFAAEITQAYIARTGRYRLVWRVHVELLTSSNPDDGKRSILNLPLLWRVRRSPCWAPSDTVIVLEGSCRELRAVVRNTQELVVCTPPLEFVAGELVHVRAETTARETALRLLQWFVLDEVVAWENAPPLEGKPPLK